MMSLDTARDMLLWCTAINYGVLLVWTLTYRLAREWVHRIWGGWFRLSAEQFDALSFAAMAIYQVGILLFNLVPYIVLTLYT